MFGADVLVTGIKDVTKQGTAGGPLGTAGDFYEEPSVQSARLSDVLNPPEGYTTDQFVDDLIRVNKLRDAKVTQIPLSPENQ